VILRGEVLCILSNSVTVSPDRSRWRPALPPRVAESRDDGRELVSISHHEVRDAPAIPAPFELVRNLVDRPDERVGRIGSVTGRQARHLLAEFTDRRVCIVSDLDDLNEGAQLNRVESIPGSSTDLIELAFEMLR